MIPEAWPPGGAGAGGGAEAVGSVVGGGSSAMTTVCPVLSWRRTKSRTLPSVAVPRPPCSPSVLRECADVSLGVKRPATSIRPGSPAAGSPPAAWPAAAPSLALAPSSAVRGAARPPDIGKAPSRGGPGRSASLSAKARGAGARWPSSGVRTMSRPPGTRRLCCWASPGAGARTGRVGTLFRRSSGACGVSTQSAIRVVCDGKGQSATTTG